MHMIWEYFVWTQTILHNQIISVKYTFKESCEDIGGPQEDIGGP